MFQSLPLLFSYYSCSGLMRWPILAAGLAAVQRGAYLRYIIHQQLSPRCAFQDSPPLFLYGTSFFLPPAKSKLEGTLETFFSHRSDLHNPSQLVSDTAPAAWRPGGGPAHHPGHCYTLGSVNQGYSRVHTTTGQWPHAPLSIPLSSHQLGKTYNSTEHDPTLLLLKSS